MSFANSGMLLSYKKSSDSAPAVRETRAAAGRCGGDGSLDSSDSCVPQFEVVEIAPHAPRRSRIAARLRIGIGEVLLEGFDADAPIQHQPPRLLVASGGLIILIAHLDSSGHLQLGSDDEFSELLDGLFFQAPVGAAEHAW